MGTIWEHDTCYSHMIAGMKLKHVMGGSFNGFSALLSSLEWEETEGGRQNEMELVTKVSARWASWTSHNAYK